jgi:hypothetical protein
LRNKYIEKLLDKAETILEERRYAFIGEMIYFSFHDGEEYMSVKEIMDNEEAHAE